MIRMRVCAPVAIVTTVAGVSMLSVTSPLTTAPGMTSQSAHRTAQTLSAAPRRFHTVSPGVQARGSHRFSVNPQASATNHKPDTVASRTVHATSRFAATGTAGQQTERAASTNTARLSSSPATPPSQLSAFQGATESAAVGQFGTDQQTAPPDTDIAVGPASVVETVNNSIFVFQRNGTLTATADVGQFVGSPAGWAVTDPRVVYDPRSGRFFFTVLNYDPSGCGPNASVVVLLVTNTVDPTGAWSGLKLHEQNALDTGDQPGLGLSDNLIAVSSNDFTCSNGAWDGSEVDMVQKSDLVNHTIGTSSVMYYNRGPFAPQPVKSLGPTTTQYVVYNNSDPPFGTPPGPSLGVFTFTGTPEQHTMPQTPPETDVPMSPTSVDPTTFSVVSAPQNTNANPTAPPLQTDDDRFLTAVWENNHIWASGNTNCTPSGDTTTRACLKYADASADSAGHVSNGSLLHDVTIGVSGSYLYYPAVAMDGGGNMITVFDQSSASAYESIVVAGMNVGAGGTSLTGFTTLHTSSTYYAYSTSCPPAGSAPNLGCRWGDYSGAAQDPSHPNDVWVASEDKDANNSGCPDTHTCWDTFIGRYTFAAPTISGLTPAAGPVAGGQTVTVNGSDFLPGTTATFAGSSISLSNLTPDSFQVTTPAHSAGIVYMSVSDALGSSAGPAPANAYLYVALGSYVPLTPFRILDTRSSPCGGGAGSCGPLLPGGTLTLQVTGYTDPITHESIPANASAVVLNVTAVDDNSPSLFTIYPNGTAQPLASNLNFFAHNNSANLVTVTLGQSSPSDAQREVNIFNALGTVNVVADVEGYFAPAAGSNPLGEFHAMPPLRVCDTRHGQPANVCNGNGANGADATLGQGSVIKVKVSGKPQGVAGSPPVIPTDGTAQAAVLNLTAVFGTSGTYLSVFPTSSDGSCRYGPSNPPPSSTINLNAFTNQANRVVVPLGPDATGQPATDVCVYNSLGSINFILDANGWFGTASAPAGAQFQAIGPSRVCDTRAGSGTGCAGSTLGPNTVITGAVAGVGGIPPVSAPQRPLAVIANLTAVYGSSGTFLSVYPADATSRPNASDLNVGPQQNLPNLVVVQLAATGASNGAVDLYNSLGTIDGIVDVEGWFQ